MYTYQTHDQTSVSVLLVMGELISWGIRQMLQKLNQIQFNQIQ
ncbi:hypothetical protein AO376_1395 [Moraxella catarrhalis]|nr:hypothetical protein AO376_1395 [Moraxella catarrhalis]OAV21681.1 hypothetical protein AO374_0014 [Moraxella catarrhalis]